MPNEHDDRVFSDPLDAVAYLAERVYSLEARVAALLAMQLVAAKIKGEDALSDGFENVIGLMGMRGNNSHPAYDEALNAVIETLQAAMSGKNES